MKMKKRTKTKTVTGLPRSERRGRANPPYVPSNLALRESDGRMANQEFCALAQEAQRGGDDCFQEEEED
jgi:hypothetical protein